MFKFLHAADIHLDSPLHKLEYYEGAPVQELRQATRRAFENLVELALVEDVDFLLIAGDLYDGDWKDYNTGLYFISQMGRLREAHIPVYIITGNHDAASKITKMLRPPEGVEIFPSGAPSTIRMDTLDVAIHGESFSSPSVKKDLSAKYPSPLPGVFNIGILHTCATGREGHEPYAPCTVEGLLSKGYDYWALGHVHKQEVLFEDPLILFPGNTQGRHIRETGSKGCVLVTVDDKGRSRADFKPLDVIRWFKIEKDVSSAETGYDVVDLLGMELEQLLEENKGLPLVVRLEIIGDSRAHDELASDMERWTNEIRSMAMDTSGERIWIEKVKLSTRLPIDTQTLESTPGPVSELIHYLDEIHYDPDILDNMGQEVLDELKRKLPRELKEGEEKIPLDDTKWLLEMLEQVRPMLLSRLMRKDDSS
jgi:DNA repair exonuclease SbcCD nuclease subunit